MLLRVPVHLHVLRVVLGSARRLGTAVELPARKVLPAAERSGGEIEASAP